MNTSRIALGLLGAACLLGGAPAHAQRGFSPVKPREAPAQAAPKEEPPPALPGSRAESMAAAPASKAALDMPPTEALFDAVNRGDLPGAKDALNRGADLNARNVLGLTPLDLAIDLGRNSITFALLSMRGAETSRQAPPVATAQAGGPRAGQRTASAPQRQAAAQPPAVQVRPARYATSPSAPAVPSSAVAQAPRRFAGDGGAPDPRAGFLGFGSTR